MTLITGTAQEELVAVCVGPGGEMSHLLQDTSFWAQGATEKLLTDWTRSVTFRMSCSTGKGGCLDLRAIYLS